MDFVSEDLVFGGESIGPSVVRRDLHRRMQLQVMLRGMVSRPMLNTNQSGLVMALIADAYAAIGTLSCLIRCTESSRGGLCGA